MKHLVGKLLFAVMACACLGANAEEYRAIVNNNSESADSLMLLIRIDSKTGDGSGFFVVRFLAQGGTVELVAEKEALLARYTNAQEQRIINQEGKVVTLEVQYEEPRFPRGTLPAPVVLSADPAVTPEFDITGGGENPLVITQR